MKKRGQRASVLAEVAERVSLWNEIRTDDFQDEVAHLVNDARELWRGDDGELPKHGDDKAFDALMALEDSADSSPEAVRDAATRVLHAAEELRIPR